jgi:hypothetical protein
VPKSVIQEDDKHAEGNNAQHLNEGPYPDDPSGCVHHPGKSGQGPPGDEQQCSRLARPENFGIRSEH